MQFEVHVKRDVRVSMRDGVTLSADIYLPSVDSKSYPAIVVRTPYGKTSTVIHNTANFYASHGYAVVYLDVRGRGDSDGEFIPYRNEAIDGYDSIEWVADQVWCDGNVGTMGGSYLARVQWLTSLTKPPHLKTMICTVSPSDPFVEWPTGLPNPQHLCWLYMTSGRVNQNVDVLDWEKIYKHLPYTTMDELTGKKFSHWQNEIEHPYLDDWWQEICYQTRFEEIDLPVLHVSGWYDDEQVGTPLNFHGMSTRGATLFARENQKMIMGPWPHQINQSTKLGDFDFGPDALIDLNGFQLRWFNYWLKGEANGIMEEPKAKLFLMGENKWVEENEWPLERTQWTKFYLQSGGNANSRFGDGILKGEVLGSGEETDTYLYDPNNPVPFITDMVSAQIGGPDNYASIERRDDVLVYTSEALPEDTEVTGPIKVQLFAASSAEDTDFTAKLIDVHPNGYAQRLCDGYVRARFRNGMDKPNWINPNEIYKYEIDCWNTSHVFKKGHQIRVEIASSAFPKYDRNLNTKTELGKTIDTVVARQTIYHNETYPSAIILPIIPKRV